jgi:hypothetical protein
MSIVSQNQKNKTNNKENPMIGLKKMITDCQETNILVTAVMAAKKVAIITLTSVRNICIN